MKSQTSGILFALLAFAVYAGHDTVVKLLGGGYSPFQVVFFTALFSFPLSTLMMMRCWERRCGCDAESPSWWA